MAMDKRKNFLYQGANLNTILNKNDQHISIFHNAELPLAQLHTQNSAKLFGSDIQNTPINLLSNTDITSLTYSPYGSSIATNHELSALGFTGQPSLMPGLYLLGHYRLLHTGLMRFNAQDSLSPFKILNGYGYGNGDPVNTIDPSGHSPWGIFGRAAAAFSRNWGRFKNYVGLGGSNRTTPQRTSGLDRNPQSKGYTVSAQVKSSAFLEPDITKVNPLFDDSASTSSVEHIYQEILPVKNQPIQNHLKSRARAPVLQKTERRTQPSRFGYSTDSSSEEDYWDTSNLRTGVRSELTSYNAWSVLIRH